MITNPNLNPNPFENQQQKYPVLPPSLNTGTFS